MPTKITLTAVPSPREKFVFFRRLLRLAAVAAVLGSYVGQPAHAWLTNSSAVLLQQQLEANLGSAGTTDHSASDVIQAFYAQRQFRPAWASPVSKLGLEYLPRLAELHGLKAADYRLQNLHQRNATDSTEDLLRLELQITATVLRLATHLRYGKMDPAGTSPRQRRAYDVDARVQLLDGAATAESLLTYLDNLAPQDLLYRKLQHKLAGYRAMQIAGSEWPWIRSGRTLEPGMHDKRMTELRMRLGLEPAIDRAIDNEELYDEALVNAVKAFQNQHRLTADGILGPRTLRALNVPLDQRIAQLRVNLEWQRWSVMPEGTDHLRVNIPHYTLQWVEDGSRRWSMRTQVGNSDRPTPAFRSAVNAISANPTWTVPPTIFREDILPELQSDAAYLQKKGMYVVDRRGQAVDSSAIDWRTTTADEFPYRLRRKPGAGNALGRMKFLLPNPYLIYLHDTPAKHLFGQPLRATSSGCIRVEDPDRLAEFLVGMQKQRSKTRLAAAMKTDKTRFIGFDAPVPIIIIYATVDLDDEGELVFADDVYNRDPEVLAVLDSSRRQRIDTLIANFSPVNHPVAAQLSADSGGDG